MFWLGALVGLFVGVLLGLLVGCLFAAASREDELLSAALAQKNVASSAASQNELRTHRV
jgi:uncharacterized membrane-anchored protein YhcB (DUF1043 family)